jgi:hypothetical protein
MFFLHMHLFFHTFLLSVFELFSLRFYLWTEQILYSKVAFKANDNIMDHTDGIYLQLDILKILEMFSIQNTLIHAIQQKLPVL